MRVCMYLSVISGKDLVIFGHRRRGAVTACGLQTQDPVFFLERGHEEQRIEEWREAGGKFSVDVLLP